MNLLLTGAAGFTRLHTARRLLANVAERAAMSSLFGTVRFDAVVPLAAQAGVRDPITHRAAHIDSCKLAGFGNIVEGRRAQQVRHPGLHQAPASAVDIPRCRLPRPPRWTIRCTRTPPPRRPSGCACWTNPPPLPLEAGGRAPDRLFSIGTNDPAQWLGFIGCIEQALGKEALKETLPMQDGDVHAPLRQHRRAARPGGSCSAHAAGGRHRAFRAWTRSHCRV